MLQDDRDPEDHDLYFPQRKIGRNAAWGALTVIATFCAIAGLAFLLM